MSSVGWYETYTLEAEGLLPLQTDIEGYNLKIRRGFGPGQLITNESGRQQLQPNIEIVRPSNCPSTICLPLD